jgi:hypothetical protein
LIRKPFLKMPSRSRSAGRSLNLFMSLLLTLGGGKFSYASSQFSGQSGQHCAIGQRVSLATQDADGRPWKLGGTGELFTILAFVQMQPDTEASESRRQALVLESFIHQHGGSGIRGALVDHAQARRTHEEEITSLRNAFFDWGLEDLEFVRDPGSEVANRLGVGAVPSLFLISGQGCIVWSHLGTVSTFALEANVAPLLHPRGPGPHFGDKQH